MYARIFIKNTGWFALPIISSAVAAGPGVVAAPVAGLALSQR